MSVGHVQRGMTRGQQRGLSIVELMVGVTIGLIIVAAATLLMTGQLVENRRLLAETQVQQDLRAASDLMSRELRRAGRNSQNHVLDSMWLPGNGEAKLNLMTTKGNLIDRYLEVIPSTSVEFDYQPSTGLDGPFRFALDGQVIKTLMGNAGLQELTDPNAMSVTALTPTLMPTLQLNAPSTTTVMPCAKPCADGTAGCWPKFEVMRVQIAVQAKSKNDNTIKRSLSSTVRLRNDRVVFSSPTSMCPV